MTIWRPVRIGVQIGDGIMHAVAMGMAKKKKKGVKFILGPACGRL